MLTNNFTQVIFTELPTKTGKLGIATLNRPEALNAISFDMVIALSEKYHAWADDPAIQAVLIQSASPRAFCAGGDLKQLYTLGRAEYEQSVPFFWHEYHLNKFIHMYPKPYIALIDGITMGGGLGISVHGSHVVAGENLIMAMPETGIGLYPDTGASFFLSHAPNNIGMYMGLTGNTISVADAILADLVQTHAPSKKFALIIQDLCAQDLSTDVESTIKQVLSKYQTDPGASKLQTHLSSIKHCFNQNSVSEVLAALRQENSIWAQEQIAIIEKRSPTSLKITHKELTLAVNMDIASCIEMELNLTAKVLQGHDIYEGIRAVVIDKTHDPKWQPARLQDVSDELIDEIFNHKWKL